MSANTLTTYAPPRGFDAAVVSGVVFFFACYTTLPQVVPDTTVWRLLTEYYPGGPTAYKNLVKMIFLPILGIHFLEVLIFDQVRMKKYNVPRGTALWWKWMANCFIEGVGTFKRVESLMAAKGPKSL